MSDQVPAQEQSAPAPTPTGRERFSGLPANEIADQIATARMNNQAPGVISELESQLAASLGATPEVKPEAGATTEQPPATPEPEVPVVEKSPEEIAAEATAAEAAAETPAPADRIRMGKEYTDADKALVNAAHMLVKGGQAKNFTEAFARVSGLATPAPEQQAEPELPAIPPEITSLETEVARLEGLMDEAGNGEGLLNKEFTDLTKQLSKANANLAAARSRYESAAETHAVVDQASIEKQRSDVLKATAREYPQMTDKNSEQWKLARDLAKAASDPSHPDYETCCSEDAPRFFAVKAAKLLQIKPATAVPVAPQPPTASTPSTQPPKPGPAPGSRTTAPAVTITPQVAIQAVEAHLANVLAGRGTAQPKQVPKYIML